MEIGKLIDSGHTSEIFEYGDKYVIKLYKKEFIELCYVEFNNYHQIKNLELNILKCYDLIEINGRNGIILDYIKGYSLNSYIKNYPFKFNKVVNQFTDNAIKISQISNVNIPSRIKITIDRLKNCNRIELELKSHLLRDIENYHFRNTLIHGDFHPQNMIIKDDKLFVIDWQYSMMSELEDEVARFKSLYLFADYFIDQKNIDWYLNSIYRQFFYRYFIINLRKKVILDEHKLKFWSLIYNILYTEEMTTEYKIKKNLKIIDNDFYHLYCG